MAKEARVFISHSSKDQKDGDAVNVRAHDVRVAIRNKLNTDYHVLIDEVELKAGDVWRARINLWLGLCDAAVLVLSPDALDSPYVAFEANVLGYRWAMDRQNFKIIPVLVGVTMDDVEKSRLNPSRVGEWQNAPIGTPDEIAEQVLQALASVVPSRSRPIDALATAMKSFLPEDDNALDAAAQALTVPELPWSIDSKGFRLALRLLGSGMADECGTAVYYLSKAADAIPDDVRTKRIRAIAELVACAWVDMKAKDIPENACGLEPRPMLLNADHRAVAAAYLMAAKYRVEPYLLYRLVEIAPEAEQNVPGQAVIDKVRDALEKAVGAKGDKLAGKLGVFHRRKEAVVVLLREHSLPPGVLSKLRREFQHVTFMVLGGRSPGSVIGAGEDLIIVEPPLNSEKDEEGLFLTARIRFFETIDLEDCP
jgi:hypothetical protein